MKPSYQRKMNQLIVKRHETTNQIYRNEQITDWENVPQFEDEVAEAAYWAATIAPRLMELALFGWRDTESVTISLRMDACSPRSSGLPGYRICKA